MLKLILNAKKDSKKTCFKVFSIKINIIKFIAYFLNIKIKKVTKLVVKAL